MCLIWEWLADCSMCNVSCNMSHSHFVCKNTLKCEKDEQITLFKQYLFWDNWETIQVQILLNSLISLTYIYIYMVDFAIFYWFMMNDVALYFQPGCSNCDALTSQLTQAQKLAKDKEQSIHDLTTKLRKYEKPTPRLDTNNKQSSRSKIR